MLPSRRPIRLAHPSLFFLGLLFVPVILALPLSVLPRPVLRQEQIATILPNATVSPTPHERLVNLSANGEANLTATGNGTERNKTAVTPAASPIGNSTPAAFPADSSTGRRMPSTEEILRSGGFGPNFPDASKSNLTLAQCNMFHDRVHRPNFSRSSVYKALAALMYFVSLAAILFTLVLVLRVRCHSAPRSTIFRASIVFASLLVFAPSMLLVVRHFLLPLDLYVDLKLKSSNAGHDVAKCKELIPGSKWPEKPLNGFAYYGTPTLRGGGFWALIGISYAFSLGLAIVVVLMCLDDLPRGDDWKSRKPAFECDCDGNASFCPHR